MAEILRFLSNVVVFGTGWRVGMLCGTHPLLQKIEQLLDTLVHAAGVSLQHQLRSLGLLVLRVDSREPCSGIRIADRLSRCFEKRNRSVVDVTQWWQLLITSGWIRRT